MNPINFKQARRAAHGLGLLLSLGLSACLDITDPLIDLEIPICTSAELREQYLRGESPSKLRELRGLWSLQIRRCIFQSDEVARSDMRWRTISARPFIIDFNQQDAKASLVTLTSDPNEIAPRISAEGVGINDVPTRLLVDLGERAYNGERMIYELRLEGGRELLVSPSERARYESDFEVITGTVYEQGQGQIGVFSLSQHPLSDAGAVAP